MTDVNVAGAHPKVVDAVSHVGKQASRVSNTQAFTKKMEVDGYKVLVAIKRVAASERFPDGVTHQIMLCVDMKAAAANRAPLGVELDMWLARQETALGVLCGSLRGGRGPFEGQGLAAYRTNPDDPWVGHITTNKDHRVSRWVLLAQRRMP